MNKQKFVSNLFWPILVVKSSRFSLIVQVKYKFETERRMAKRLLVLQELGAWWYVRSVKLGGIFSFSVFVLNSFKAKYKHKNSRELMFF